MSQNILEFIHMMTGPSPSQCIDDGLDMEDSFQPMIVEIFSTGCCGNFAIMLQMAFGGKIYHSPNNHHVVTRIDNRDYDITGDVTNRYDDLVPITKLELHQRDYVNNYSMDLGGPIV